MSPQAYRPAEPPEVPQASDYEAYGLSESLYPSPEGSGEHLLPVDHEPGWIKRTVGRAAVWIDESIDHVVERRPGWGRRAVAIGMLAVTQMGTLTGVGYAAAEAIKDDLQAQIGHELGTTPTVGSTEPAKPVLELSPEQRLYEASNAVVLDTPFEPDFISPENLSALDAAELRFIHASAKLSEVPANGVGIPDESLTPEQLAFKREYKDALQKRDSLRQEYGPDADEQRFEKNIQNILKSYEAQFELATQLSSGMRVNIYSSRADSSTEPLGVDVKALDVFVNKLISLAGDVPTNPANAEIAHLQELAAKGELDLKLDVVLLSDEKLCIAKQKVLGMEAGHGLQPVSEGYCVASGVNERKRSAPTRNQLVIALDSGSDGFLVGGQFAPEALGSNRAATLILGHEITHVLFGMTESNGDISVDEEHWDFVYPVQERLINYLVTSSPSSRDQISFALPILIEDDPLRPLSPAMHRIR